MSVFRGVDGVRSRSVSRVVLSGTLDIAPAPASLAADWEREVLRLGLQAGDVEALSLARARTRWPQVRHSVQAVSDWTRPLGLERVLGASDVALMACRGARYHHDGDQYGSATFCNLFLSEDKGLDLHFPGADRRIALTRGTVVVFDTGQPHAVIERGRAGYDAVDFPEGRDCTQVFLTWELPVESARVAQALGITFETTPWRVLPVHEEGLWRNGVPARVCPLSGEWLRCS